MTQKVIVNIIQTGQWVLYVLRLNEMVCILLIFYVWLLQFVFYKASSSSTPPRHPPAEAQFAYTMEGLIPMEYMYIDDTNGGEPTHFIYGAADMKNVGVSMGKMILQFERIIRGYCSTDDSMVNSQLATEKNRTHNENIGILKSIKDQSVLHFNISVAKNILFSLPKAQWAPFALYIYSGKIVQNKNIAVYGSVDPWLESFLILLGAQHVVTIEYNRLTYEDSRITTIAMDGFAELYSSTGKYAKYFDTVISLSAFDHDGLGRYGDPLNPNGDLSVMQLVKTIIKPTGIMMLTVPIGPDVVVFNLHRRYGRNRLPKLLDGWKVVEKLGWIESKLEENADWRQTYEPVLMMIPQNTISSLNEGEL